MEKHEDVTTILTKLDLDDIEEMVSQPHHETGPGRPPRSPLGIFKALMIKQLRCIPSDRELYRRLWNDEAPRQICLIEEREKPQPSIPANQVQKQSRPGEASRNHQVPPGEARRGGRR